MKSNKILLFSFLFILTYCNGQEKTKTFKDPNTSKSGPTVIRNFKGVAVAPDFDTTLVSQIYPEYFSGFERGIYGLAPWAKA